MEKRRGSGRLQNVAVDPTAIYRLRFGVWRCFAAFDDLYGSADLLRRAYYAFGAFEAIGGRALCQSVLCS
jgi:hypothetical protein